MFFGGEFSALCEADGVALSFDACFVGVAGLTECLKVLVVVCAAVGDSGDVVDFSAWVSAFLACVFIAFKCVFCDVVGCVSLSHIGIARVVVDSLLALWRLAYHMGVDIV